MRHHGHGLLSAFSTKDRGHRADDQRGSPAARPSRTRQEGGCELHAEAWLWALAWDVFCERPGRVPRLNARTVWAGTAVDGQLPSVNRPATWKSCNSGCHPWHRGNTPPPMVNEGTLAGTPKPGWPRRQRGVCRPLREGRRRAMSDAAWEGGASEGGGAFPNGDLEHSVWLLNTCGR